MLAKLDIAMQQSVANKEVSGVIGLIQHSGQRGSFEAFGIPDIEAMDTRESCYNETYPEFNLREETQ